MSGVISGVKAEVLRSAFSHDFALKSGVAKGVSEKRRQAQGKRRRAGAGEKDGEYC